jgi:predicted metal-dependent hydrolase
MTQRRKTEHHSNISIRKQNRKTLAMRVSPYGEIDVLIPYWIKPESREVRQFVEHAIEQLKFVPYETVPALHDEPIIRRLTKKWARRIQVVPERVQVRRMMRKWGSCSSRGTVTLNSVLCYLPLPLVEYVIVHELVHLLILDHSPAFWSKVAEYMPDYESLEHELNQYHL